MSAEQRFQGAMSADYMLVRLAIPDFDALQRLVAGAVADYAPAGSSAPLRLLDLGCGDGVTSHAILSGRPDVLVTSLDNEAMMARQATDRLASFIGAGRCQVVLHDALGYLGGQRESTFDVVASALALHNLHRDYRHKLHQEIYRVLRPGGLFVNADKYASSDEQRFGALQGTLGRFFDLFVPLGKLDLLRACVLHEVADERPERVMWEADTVRELADLGFGNAEVRSRLQMAALLVANKPGLPLGVRRH